MNDVSGFASATTHKKAKEALYRGNIDEAAYLIREIQRDNLETKTA